MGWLIQGVVYLPEVSQYCILGVASGSSPPRAPPTNPLAISHLTRSNGIVRYRPRRLHRIVASPPHYSSLLTLRQPLSYLRPPPHPHPKRARLPSRVITPPQDISSFIYIMCFLILHIRLDMGCRGKVLFTRPLLPCFLKTSRLVQPPLLEMLE